MPIRVVVIDNIAVDDLRSLLIHYANPAIHCLGLCLVYGLVLKLTVKYISKITSLDDVKRIVTNQRFSFISEISFQNRVKRSGSSQTIEPSSHMHRYL